MISLDADHVDRIAPLAAKASGFLFVQPSGNRITAVQPAR
jgi:hypothetical protein